MKKSSFSKIGANICKYINAVVIIFEFFFHQTLNLKYLIQNPAVISFITPNPLKRGYNYWNQELVGLRIGYNYGNQKIERG